MLWINLDSQMFWSFQAATIYVFSLRKFKSCYASLYAHSTIFTAYWVILKEEISLEFEKYLQSKKSLYISVLDRAPGISQKKCE